MNHKKALKKILKWAGSLLLSSLFTAPVIFILIICGVVIALFGKSSTSSGDVSFSETFLFQKRQLPFASFFQMPDIQIFKLRQFWEIWNGNHDWITTLLPS